MIYIFLLHLLIWLFILLIGIYNRLLFDLFSAASTCCNKKIYKDLRQVAIVFATKVMLFEVFKLDVVMAFRAFQQVKLAVNVCRKQISVQKIR